MARLALKASLAALLLTTPLHAQQARVVASCGALAPFGPNAVGQSALPTQDITGKLCTSGGGGGGGTITANSTPTSGFTSGQLLVSDGSKVQATTPLTVVTPPWIASVATFALNNQAVLELDGGTVGYGAMGLEAGGIFGWGNGNGQFISSGSYDISLYRDAAGILADRTGTASQALRVYNTFTDASNGEWGALDWQTTANVLTIGTQKNGTGTARNLQLVVGGASQLDYGITAVGNWTANSNFGTTGALVSRGTKPVLNTGACVGSSGVGGAIAGTLQTTSACAGTTLILSSLPTAPTGYSCSMQDRTTTADLTVQQSTTTTSATFKATTAANDILQFQCQAY
jgi:hypothetical protein